MPGPKPSIVFSVEFAHPSRVGRIAKLGGSHQRNRYHVEPYDTPLAGNGRRGSGESAAFTPTASDDTRN